MYKSRPSTAVEKNHAYDFPVRAEQVREQYKADMPANAISSLIKTKIQIIPPFYFSFRSQGSWFRFFVST